MAWITVLYTRLFYKGGSPHQFHEGHLLVDFYVRHGISTSLCFPRKFMGPAETLLTGVLPHRSAREVVLDGGPFCKLRQAISKTATGPCNVQFLGMCFWFRFLSLPAQTCLYCAIFMAARYFPALRKGVCAETTARRPQQNDGHIIGPRDRRKGTHAAKTLFETCLAPRLALVLRNVLAPRFALGFTSV